MRTATEVLCALSAQDWTRVTLVMSWHYRAGRPPHPVVVKAFDGTPPDHKAWENLTRDVRRLRRAERMATKRASAADKKVKRREYMREYMKQRRTTI